MPKRDGEAEVVHVKGLLEQGEKFMRAAMREPAQAVSGHPQRNQLCAVAQSPAHSTLVRTAREDDEACDRVTAFGAQGRALARDQR